MATVKLHTQIGCAMSNAINDSLSAFGTYTRYMQILRAELQLPGSLIRVPAWRPSV